MPEPTSQQLFDLTGRVALITDGSGHLGRSLSRALAESGATVVVGSRDEDRAQRAAAELPTPGATVHHGVSLDQMNEDSLNQGFHAALEAAARIDILVNNGHLGHALDLTNVTGDAFSEGLRNATGYFLLARRLRDHLVDRQASGSVVMLGSMYGVVGSYPDAYKEVCTVSSVQYHALKGGIVHMTRHLAVYWAKDRVRVNCLSPEPFPNPTIQEELVARLKTRSPMGRMGAPHELKGPLLLLVGDAGSYITGQNLLVDGGWTAW